MCKIYHGREGEELFLTQLYPRVAQKLKWQKSHNGAKYLSSVDVTTNVGIGAVSIAC